MFASLERGYIGNTDGDWFRFLAALDARQRDETGRGLDEINFWVPSGRSFRALKPGEPFFLRLKSPVYRIGGFGFFAHFTRVPAWLAWELFGELNGAPSQQRFYEMLAQYIARKGPPLSPREVARHEVGCIVLAQPVFLQESQWLPQPPDWSPNVVAGKKIELGSFYGRRLAGACMAALEGVGERGTGTRASEPLASYGEGHVERVARVRLGQGAFRSLLLDAYGRACAVTREHSLPVLEAAHIRPYAETERHDPSNGILLRTDLHRLFDRGYVTVTVDHRFEVSSRLRDEWDNGKTYYALQGRPVHVPTDPRLRPDPEALRWHNEHVFLAGGA